MSLIHMSIPSPQSQIESLQRELYQRNKQLADAEEALRLEKLMNQTLHTAVDTLRMTLQPLYSGLRLIFEQIDASGVESPTKARNSAVWESWKQKLSGTAAKAIDVLHLHGEMNGEQLRIHLGCATRTCYNIIGELNKAKLIDKNGGRISLKEL